MQEQKSITKPSNIVFIIGIVIAIVFPLAASFLIGSLPLNMSDKAFYSRFIYWTEVLFLWWYAKQCENQPLLIWKEKQFGAKFILKWAILLYLLSLVAAVISLIPSWLGFHENKDIIHQIARMVKGRPLFIVFISLTAGVTEEIIFRGYILTRLSLMLKNQYIPIIISAILFAGLHYKYHSPREYIFAFLIGILMGLHYKKYGNIKPLIITHFLVDLIGLAIMQHVIK
ncbi:MAG: family intrarane metalloprotease [Mucilaginibacter sp.]|uniref:CPBP family intramembrane glutamic endopeptidase n=1 Tax=Mucilaginibacter sp. TaxID=1882438 RepID=UPI0026386B01|nr:type II CAAX endopeptidase family protein [Mucilaginibacter sp.]MDB5003105.1 family intrarane metalloprotease [Mucilaginibacter sp.]